MTRAVLRRWVWVHTWTSLVCTLFLLLICLTGLPLVFEEEIDNWLDNDPPYAALPAETPAANLDRLVATSRGLYPGEIITSIFIDDDEPKVIVSMAPSWEIANANPKAQHWIKFDARTGEMLKRSKPIGEEPATFTGLMLDLHRDLFMGLPGELFMGSMALLFVVAVVSGIVLYSPFMRRLDFGTVRRGRSPRLKWLDMHNLLGVTTLAWALVVGATGAMNELSTPLFGLWQRTDVAAMLESWRDHPVPAVSDLGSVQSAQDAAKAALPDMRVSSIIFPGSKFGTPYHYLLWAKGETPLTSRLFNPVLVDARTGNLDGIVAMPWYLRALEVSRPLHFGDYGGVPLKIIWILLDLVTIVVLASGLYLWFGKRSRVEAGSGEGNSNAEFNLGASREAAE